MLILLVVDRASKYQRNCKRIQTNVEHIFQVAKDSKNIAGIDVCPVFYVYVLCVTAKISGKHCSVTGFGTGYSWVREDHSPSELAKLGKNVRTMTSLIPVIPKLKHFNQVNCAETSVVRYPNEAISTWKVSKQMQCLHGPNSRISCPTHAPVSTKDTLRP